MEAAGAESEAPGTTDPFAAPLDLGTLRSAFPQLEILAPLGAGGMGRVYKVRQPHLDRIVALKVVPPEFARDPAWVERFTREARALARLNHPNIVQVYDFGLSAHVPPLCWLLMEFVDGVTLRQVQRTGGLSSREALTLIPKLCDALQYAHEKGVLHRDIKPENILLDASGGVKIADFGLAKLGGPNPSPTLTLTGARLGTAAYMAPEQIESPQDVDHRADIYSLGVVLYELLTGGLPLGRFPAPSEKSGTDPRLDHIVFRTLEKERDRRYQAAGDVRTALDSVAAQPPPPVPAAPVKPEPREQKATRPRTPVEPPPLPPGAVTRVTYSDRGKPFPSSPSDGWGGCGALMIFPFQLPLALAAAVIPVAAYEGLAEMTWGRFLLREHPEVGILIAVLTGLCAVWFARPVMATLWLPLKPGVKRARPWLAAAAVLLWGSAITLVAGIANSWPSRGGDAQMIFTFTRPPQSPGSSASSDLELDAMLAARLAELTRDGSLTVMEIGDFDANRNYYSSVYLPPVSPLMKRWRVVAAGASELSARNALIAAGARLISSLPESVRSSADFQVTRYDYRQRDWPFKLSSDIGLAGMGILMTLGGWLVALCRPSSAIYRTVPCLLVAGGLLLFLKPPGFVPGLVPVPATEFPAEDPWLNGGLVRLLGDSAEKNDNDAKAAAHRFIDACLRLDRPLVQSMMEVPLLSNDWESLVTTWTNSYVLRVIEEPQDDAVVWIKLYLIRKPAFEDGLFEPRRLEEGRGGRWVQLKLKKTGEQWTVSREVRELQP